MVDEANASIAAAVKADPAHAALYLRNLAVIFFQEKNVSAQIDAADAAIKANPQDAVLYFVKAQGLSVDAPIDPDTNKIKLSPECVVAFREYLGLAPTGEYAAQVTSILQNADPQNTQNDLGATEPARRNQSACANRRRRRKNSSPSPLAKWRRPPGPHIAILPQRSTILSMARKSTSMSNDALLTYAEAAAFVAKRAERLARS